MPTQVPDISLGLQFVFLSVGIRLPLRPHFTWGSSFSNYQVPSAGQAILEERGVVLLIVLYHV